MRFAALHNRQLFLDYGPHIRRGKMKIHPPQPVNKGEYHILVPKVDEDGNDVAGIRLPAVQVPVGTLYRVESPAARPGRRRIGGLAWLLYPFCKNKGATATHRRSTADRIEERYKNRDDYVRQISRAARRLVEQRYLLSEDAERMIAEAKKRRVP